MTIYIISSDKSIHSVEALQYSINKYWKPNPNVVILSYEQPKNFKFEKNFNLGSMGSDKGYNYVNQKLIDYFSKVEESHFIFSCDDFPLIRPVDMVMFNKLKQKMIDENISRVAMNNHIKTKPYDTIESSDGYDIVEMSQSADYRKSAIWSIWEKNYFLKYLHGTSNLWEWELDERCKNDGHRIIGTVGKSIVQACHLFKRTKLKGNWFQDSEGVDEAFKNDRNKIQEFIDKWKSEGIID